MARVVKRLCLPVGSYTPEGKEPKIEYREIGVIIEFESKRDNSTWQEVRLNLDILNPALFQLAKAQAEKGTSTARVKLFDISRSTKATGAAEPPPDDDAFGGPPGDEDIPF